MKRCLLLEGLLLLVSAQFASSGSHSHYFYTTLTYNSSFDSASYYTTRTIDDITLYWFDSDNRVIERRVPWFKGPNASLFIFSIRSQRYHTGMQQLLYGIVQHLNHTEGFHILQISEGCTRCDNGSVQATLSHRYDGDPFMSFNMETERWTLETPEAETIAQSFNSNKTVLEQIHHDMTNTCVSHITELLALGNCTFNRKEAPVVKVSNFPVDHGTLRVHCRAYGHYPKNISIMWYKNGQQISEEMMERMTLPLLDLTYLTSLSFNVTSMADDVYTCRVNHSSMLRDFTQDWRISSDFGNLYSAPSGRFVGTVIAICLAVILIVVFIVFGSVSFARNRRQ
ncbi:major histocompatibility complex class I-related gene protein-like [Phyllobates terribilis]|uniref:major histocompatibility complex class I-related gene protein-like n=1 Tax=Phyllobates terribilis TaxID=111132 RepID=UPI003CCB35F1